MVGSPRDAVDTRVAEREAKAITAGEAVQAAVLSVVLTSFWLVVTPLVQQPVCCDAGEYLRLARDPTSPMLRPYSMRVLVPWLAHALGGDVVTTFHAVSLVCLAIAGWLIYLLARQLGVGHGYALLATAALLCSRGWLFFFYDPYLTEPAAFLLLTAAFLVLVRNRRTWLIAPLLVLMAATREQFVGFALPTYFWLSHRHLDRRALSQTIGLFLPALVVFAALATLPHVLPPTPFSQPMGFAYTLDRRMEGDGWLWFASAFAMSLGVWWPLAVVSLRVDRFRGLSWWLIPVLAYLILIGWSIEIVFLFLVTGIIFVKQLPPDRRTRILGVPNRLFLVFAFSCLCVLIEVFLESTGYFHWEYWWWNVPFVPLIVAFGYMTFFAIAAYVYDLGTNRSKQLRIVGSMAAINAGLAIGLGLAGWL